LQNKKEVVDFDLNKNYLQNNLDLKREQDLAKTATSFDIVHVKVYKAEDLPKLDKIGNSWCDAFIELEYKGLMSAGSKLKSKPVLKSANPIWNMEFTIPIVHGAPLVYNAFELVVKNHNTLQSNDWIGKCEVNISDILALPEQSPPMWKSLYQDLDGKGQRTNTRTTTTRRGEERSEQRHNRIIARIHTLGTPHLLDVDRATRSREQAFLSPRCRN
jgi:Ca2+-dependent lipid-binding protein